MALWLRSLLQLKALFLSSIPKGACITHDAQQEILAALADNANQIQALRNDVQPMIEIFNTLKFLGKWAGILIAFLGSLTALALGIKGLFRK